MVTVRRLLGLNAEAGSEDIRAFFHGLHIPEGGVHIIGGRRGEAFIIFTTEKDGQLAMERNGELLKGSSITLHVSSLAEFKRKIESRLRKRKRSVVDKKAAQMERKKPDVEKVVADPQAAALPELGTALLLGIMAAFQGIQSNSQESQSQSLPASTHQLPASPRPHQSGNQMIQGMDQTRHINKGKQSIAQPMIVHIGEPESSRREIKSHEPGYLRLYGLPNHVTKNEVHRILEGLSVLEVIPSVFLGRDYCCLVKVASLEEAEEGLKYSHRTLEDSCVEIRMAHERMWIYATKLYEYGQCSMSSEPDRISPDGHLFQTSPVKRVPEDRSLSRSPKRYRFDSPPLTTEYCVMVKNLSSRTTKTEIKELFSCFHLPNNKIIHLLNKWGERTSTAFIIFTHPEDYASAMNMDGSPNGSKTLVVSSITRDKMKELMYKERLKETKRSHLPEKDWTAPSCIYARNFPADVRKIEVKDFFCLFHISEDDIMLLKDGNGNGTGEALVEFSCEQTAKEAHSLHGDIFLGQKILLTCISPQQMRSILQETH
ncbi:RNA binding motif protein 12Ba [Colossoma macropomum]|uniref:RNA binding motif protein 12Ba n=1 Tax=Colossoma macropomum TaxID=42526 RepID=UPI001863ABDB|nr:RNA binding motif protein 12Ba [Colossoma macropomum]XP_036413933.1 RNA binding motif protein 12Ba [Colossoma macropomum]